MMMGMFASGAAASQGQQQPPLPPQGYGASQGNCIAVYNRRMKCLMGTKLLSNNRFKSYPRTFTTYVSALKVVKSRIGYNINFGTLL